MKYFFILLLFFINVLYSQSLWVETNPYSTGTQGLKQGAVLRILLKDGIKADYRYESGKDDTITIKSAPDKKIVPELMGYNYDRSIAAKVNGKEKSNFKIIGAMAVTVKSIDPNSGVLTVEGIREATFDKGKSSLKLSGKVSQEDIKGGNTIPSDLVADLKLEYSSSPVEKKLNDPNIQMKPALDPKGNQIIGPDGQPVQKAELSENEKQKIILNNIKKLLGESQ
ncbi:MAG: flagellar basal body L-ring protein FlgH [Leptospiraceae bacterium]|nr:flagellar basal body L-ring protein FlgH [Leptospiraceae bacterium]